MHTFMFLIWNECVHLCTFDELLKKPEVPQYPKFVILLSFMRHFDAYLTLFDSTHRLLEVFENDNNSPLPAL